MHDPIQTQRYSRMANDKKAIVEAVKKVFPLAIRERIRIEPVSHKMMKGQRLGQYLMNKHVPKAKPSEYTQLVFNTDDEQAIWQGIYE